MHPDVLILDSPRLWAFWNPDPPYPYRRVETPDELIAEMRLAGASTVALIDPFSPRGRLTWGARAILGAAHMVPVVAVTELTPGHVPALRELLGLGLSDFIDVSVEATGPAILPRLRAAVGRPLKRRLEPALPPYLSQGALTLIRAVVEAEALGRGAPGLAAALGARERTVAAWCAREGVVGPARMQTWIRVLLALALLEDPRRTVLNAALSVGYATEKSLRRALRASVGERAGGTPRGCSFDAAASAFRAELGNLRDERRQARAA